MSKVIDDELAADDKINPPHYKQGKIECIEAVEAAGYGIAFCAGNAMKYLWRLNHKDTSLVNAKKAQWYVNRLVKNLEESSENPLSPEGTQHETDPNLLP